MTLQQADVEKFKSDVRGELIQPDDPGYEQARKVYNGMIDRRPRMIVCCANVADVIRSDFWSLERPKIRSGDAVKAVIADRSER